jgi:enterobacteria phage integrase
MGRPRSPKKRNWPDYLYERNRKGPYYVWVHPKTGQEFGLGRDFAKARGQALAANIKLAQQDHQVTLADRVTNKAGGTVAEFVPVYRAIIEGEGVAANTLKTLDSNLRRISKAVGTMAMPGVTTKNLFDLIIEPLEKEKKNRTAGQIWSTLDGMWKAAAGQGKVTHNPVTNLRVKSASVKRERLTLPTFMTIYEAAKKSKDRWHAKLMRLALVSAQPRECLVLWEFTDVQEGFLWNERGKTGARIKIPTSLTLPGVGWTLEECIKDCRDHVLSRHLLHHNIGRTKSPPGSAVSLNAASKAFQRARERTDLTWPDDRLPPSLHEIRSLSLRLYRDAFGRDFAQALAGHKDGSTTDIYTDVRGAEWIEVRSA